MVSPRTAPMATAPRPKLQSGILRPDRVKSREDGTHQGADQRDGGDGPRGLAALVALVLLDLEQLLANVMHFTDLRWKARRWCGAPRARLIIAAKNLIASLSAAAPAAPRRGSRRPGR